MKTTLILFLSPLTLLAAPQYGGGGGGQAAPSQAQAVKCRTENQVVWDTKYVETETQNCVTVNVPQCKTAYRRQCVPTTRQQCQTVYKHECSTDYKEDCEYQWEGTGNNKVWAPIPGSCRN